MRKYVEDRPNSNFRLAFRSQNQPEKSLSGFSGGFAFLFALFSLYLILPIVDIPILGLSLSAPLFFFIAIKCLFKPPTPWFRNYQGWIINVILIWFGIFMGSMINGIASNGVEFDKQGYLSLLRYAYFLLVFVITTYYASQGDILKKTTRLLGWGVFILAFLRWSELLILGNTTPRLLSQNSYGMLFSAFSPFALLLNLEKKGSRNVWTILRLIVIWGAIIMNGSRSSWVAVLIGHLIILFLFMIKRPKQFVSIFLILIIVLGLSVVVISIIPSLSEIVKNRVSTLENLETDRSFETRSLMNQKSISLFKISPIIGVGIGRYRLESVALEIPKLLSHRSEAYLNRLSAHNSYLSFLAENGLLGGVPLAILIITLLVRGTKQVFIFTRLEQYWGVAVLISFIQMSIHMWTLSTFSNTMNWFVYGLVGALIMIGKKSPVVGLDHE